MEFSKFPVNGRISCDIKRSYKDTQVRIRCDTVFYCALIFYDRIILLAFIGSQKFIS